VKPEQAVASIEAVAEKLREAASALAEVAGPIREAFAKAEKAERQLRADADNRFKELQSSAQQNEEQLRDKAERTETDLKKAVKKTESELKQTTASLSQAETSLATAESALAKIEGSILEMIAAATHALHDPEVPLKGRQRMLGLATKVFAQLQGSGFEVIIPEIGVNVDPSRHSVKGRAKSHLDGTHVADVVSWGYRFPNGSGKTAEVLVGDASLAPVKEEPLPEEPSEKEGIKMIVEEEGTPKAKAKAKKQEPETMFEILAEAAEKNTK
jgi:hypothetical protein